MVMLDNYLNLIPSQHRDKPKFINWLTANLKPLDDVFELAVFFDDQFDIDGAEGKQLDLLGQIVGRSRIVSFEPRPTAISVLEDEIYRKVLKAKIVQNLWKGRINDLSEMWEGLFEEELIIRDNQDMTMTLIMPDQEYSIVYDLLKRGYLVPKPQSVGINYQIEFPRIAIILQPIYQATFTLTNRTLYYFWGNRRRYYPLDGCVLLDGSITLGDWMTLQILDGGLRLDGTSLLDGYTSYGANEPHIVRFFLAHKTNSENWLST